MPRGFPDFYKQRDRSIRSGQTDKSAMLEHAPGENRRILLEEARLTAQNAPPPVHPL